MKYLFTLLIALPCYAGYFTDHVKDSIAVNSKRKPFYSKLTEGKSDPAMKKLILLEKKMLPFSVFYDARASWYHRRGIPVLKDEFVPMIALPEIDPEAPAPENNISDIPWQKYKSEFKEIIRKKDRTKLLSRSLEIIHELENQKEYWCLTRHLVESIYRVAWFLPVRIKEARAKKVKSPENLIWDIIDFHLVAFSRFAEIDSMAAPVQKSGVPMICSELPDLLSDLPYTTVKNLDK